MSSTPTFLPEGRKKKGFFEGWKRRDALESSWRDSREKTFLTSLSSVCNSCTPSSSHSLYIEDAQLYLESLELPYGAGGWKVVRRSSRIDKDKKTNCRTRSRSRVPPTD